MARLIVLAGSLAWVILLAVIGGVLGFLCAIGVPVFGSLGIAKLLGEPLPLTYGQLMVLTVGCGVLRGVLRLGEQYSNHYIAFKLLAVLRDKIFRALRILCPAKLESKQKGAIIAMLTADIETLEVFYAHTVSPVCIAVLVSLSMLLFVGLYSSWYLALAAFIGYLVIGVAIPLVSSGKLRPSGVAYRREFASFNGYFLDSVKGVKDIVLNNAGPARAGEVEVRSERLQEQTALSKHASALAAGTTELCVSVFIMISLFAGIGLYSAGMLTAGRMIAGVAAIFSSFGPVIAVSALPGNLTQTFASGDRILDLMEEKPAAEPVTDGRTFEFESLEVRDLSFCYEEEEVLRHVSLTARRGEIVGIVGPSGCGKSTLLKLLLRFWKKDSGEILYNGTDIDRINSESLLDNVTMVSQSTYIFDETIEQNLRMAKPNASMEEIARACRKASVHDFIMQLPEGYQTRAGALGDNLSAGEKQRIGLARAFLHDSPVILLDEPTSNVDSINEGIILRSIRRERQNKCIILVSHRASTMAIADRVYAIDRGTIRKER
nr:ABC transporter ATP-binding protein [Lientehia hominis]